MFARTPSSSLDAVALTVARDGDGSTTNAVIGSARDDPPPRHRPWSHRLRRAALDNCADRLRSGRPGAVTGGDIIDFVGLMQARSSFFDCCVLGCYQLESARDEVNVRIDRGCFGNDGLDARVRTANQQHDAVGRVDGKRQLLQLFRVRWRSSTGIRSFAN